MNHPLLLTACTFLMVMVLMSWVAYRLFYKPGRFMKQLGTPVIHGESSVMVGEIADGETAPSAVVTFLQQIGSRVNNPEDVEVKDIRTDLIRAGFRSEHALGVLYGVRVIAALVMAALCGLLVMRLPQANLPMSVILIAFGGVIGWILPKMFLERRVKSRQEIIRLSLPDALDLLVVSIEAGLGLDMALQHVARELQVSHPQLSEELSLVTLEMRAGKRRADALRNFADRTGEGEVRKLVAILVQSDRFGTSMGESLRTHSDFMRTRRRQDAEERAGKVGVKLVFPIFFFILPSMLVVAAGPGILQIVKYLFPMMRQIHN